MADPAQQDAAPATVPPRVGATVHVRAMLPDTKARRATQEGPPRLLRAFVSQRPPWHSAGVTAPASASAEPPPLASHPRGPFSC